MAIVKVDKLEGAALDWAVAKCEGEHLVFNPTYCGELLKGIWIPVGKHYKGIPNYSGSWGWGGPIIEREGITPEAKRVGVGEFVGFAYTWSKHVAQYGSTQLIAAMRCYVASKVGNEIEIPDELLMECI